MQAAQTFSHAPSVAGRYSDTERSSVINLKANVAAALCYFGPFGLVFLVLERQSRLVRFHAVQALLYGVMLIALLIVLGIVGGVAGFALSYVSHALGALAFVLAGLVFVAFAVGAPLIGIYKAFKGQMYKLPVIGKFAEKSANK